MDAQKSGSGPSMRLFRSPFFEACSRTHPASPALAYGPLSLAFLVWAVHTLAAWEVAVGFAGGWLLWTVVEYSAHRFVYHFPARSERSRRLLFIVHGVHHAEPGDPMRCVLPLTLTVPIAAVLWVTLQWPLGTWFPAVGAGLAFGYAAYESLHYAVHNWPMRHPLVHHLKQHHMRHHARTDAHVNYGVSAFVWDHVLGTAEVRRSRRDAA